MDLHQNARLTFRSREALAKKIMIERLTVNAAAAAWLAHLYVFCKGGDSCSRLAIERHMVSTGRKQIPRLRSDDRVGEEAETNVHPRSWCCLLSWPD
jgi:hypothetical protein